MSRPLLYRLAAVGLIAGAILTSVGNLLAPQGGARMAVASWTYYPAAVGVLVGGLLIMGSWVAVYLRQHAESGMLGFLGMLGVFVGGVLLSVSFPLVQVIVYPWIATMSVSDKALNEGPVSFIVFFAVTSFIVSLGGVLFGVATIRAKVFSRGLGIGFIVLAGLSFVLGFLSVPGGGGVPMSWWWGTTGTFGVVAYMVVLAWSGIELLRIAASAPRE